jgi:hypothetical protein
MDKNFCQQIDHESLVEQYVAGKLRGELLEKFEQHLKDCEDHAQAVLLEKALKRGISEFARGEIKSNLKNRLKKREDTRFLILRYAAILFVAVITPLLLYYQLNVAPEEMSIAEREENLIVDEAIDGHEGDLPEVEGPPKTEVRSKSSSIGSEEEKLVKPTTSAGSAYKKPQEDSNQPEKVRRLEIAKKQQAKSENMQDMLKAVKASPPPKIEADYPLEEEIQTAGEQPPAAAIRGYSQGKQSNILMNEINKKVKEDSLSIKECIDKFLGETERQKYEIEISIQILNDGKIGEIELVKTTHQSVDLESCLFTNIKSWTLPADIEEGIVVQKIGY